MIVIVLLLFVVILLGANAYVFVRLSQALPILPQAVRIFLIVCFALLSCSMFASMLLRHTIIPAFVSRLLFMTGSVWLVFLLYMVLSLALLDGLSWIGCVVPYRFFFALLFTSVILVVGNWNYKHTKINKLNIVNWNRLKPLTIVGISDVHLGDGTRRAQLAYYVDLINQQEPDVVFIAGDLIDNSIKPLYRDNMAEEFKRLNAPMGIYMVPGNHEYISGIKEVERFLSNTSITLLRDSVVTLDGGIQLVGRDDKSNKSRSSLSELLKKVSFQQPVIVLDHQPYCIEEAENLGVDLLFCGHTHRGQIWPLTWLTDCLFLQSHGYRRWSDTHVYVSQGLSLWGPPFRIGSESELVVFKIQVD